MGYLAMPTAAKAPGVVVIQEIFSVNDVMRGITDWLSDEGFIALCPDLFLLQEPGVKLTDKTDAEWARAVQLMQGFDLDKGIDDLGATIETLRRNAGYNGKIRSVGFTPSWTQTRRPRFTIIRALATLSLAPAANISIRRRRAPQTAVRSRSCARPSVERPAEKRRPVRLV